MRIRRLVMLRHGQTEFNAGSRMQGQMDTDLTDLGRAQAFAAAEVLAKRQPLLIVSSDLRRAYDTAATLGECCELPVRIDPRLRETHLGDWQGLTHQQVEPDAGCPNAERMGPYATEAVAAAALERAHERNEEFDKDDD